MTIRLEQILIRDSVSSIGSCFQMFLMVTELTNIQLGTHIAGKI